MLNEVSVDINFIEIGQVEVMLWYFWWALDVIFFGMVCSFSICLLFARAENSHDM